MMNFNKQAQNFLELVRSGQSKKTKFIGLYGAAGTGKTTLIKKIKGNIAFTAPTNKAVKVLQESGLPYEDCMTIYRFFGLKVNENHGTLTIDPKNKDLQYAYDTLIVDETSMCDKLISAYIATTTVRRVILSGDTHQLPPVNEEISKTFELPGESFVALTQQYRQGDKDHPLTPILADLRIAIDNKVKMSLPVKSSQITDGNGKKTGFVLTDSRDKFLLWSKKVFERGDDSCCVIAYRNARVDEINQKIHNFLYPQGGAYCVGEKLIFQASAYDESDNVLALNGDDIFIYSAEETVKTIEGLDSIECLLINDKFLIPCDRKKHSLFMGRLASDIKQRKSKLSWKDFYKIRDEFCDVRHAYCMTSYKSQGSTFDNVFVDTIDIQSIPNSNIKIINQHIYTALSRARHNAVILV